jgi:hypothetical protein
MNENSARGHARPTALPARIALPALLATALGACSTGAGFDGHSPQVADTSGRTRDALQACLAARLARYGTPTIEQDPARVKLRYEQASPPLTIVVNDEPGEDRSIEAWREGPRDRQLRRDVLGCK